jgi:acyl-CoA dehydrogenase
MMEALEYSRIHNAVGSAGVSRRAFLEAASWASHRKAFGKAIVEYPMVQNELMHLMVRSEAATALAFQAARTFDASQADDALNPWLRLSTALAKYRTAEDAVQCSKRALEIVGGNGYTEEFPTARLFRDSMVLPVWEGPANIQALEVLRLVAGKEPGDRAFAGKIRTIVEALPPELAEEKRLLDKGLVDATDALTYLRANPQDGERYARNVMDHMADLLSGALLADEAAYDLTLGDARKKLIAKHYLEKAFGPNQLNLSAGVDPVHRHFDALVGYAPIPPEDLRVKGVRPSFESYVEA